ncbi:Unconventional myosin-XV [Aix galericulata]|nr:Unconventional myosin-XV [Aix galericulata]
MKFMGDHPPRGQTELDMVCTLLKLCAEHEALRDEVYCQIVKQLTDNTSSKPDSCQKGWRLLYILTAYYRCSEVLRPCLLAFLQGASGRPELPFHGISKACEQNFRKTLQFGGRSLFPSSMELKAMVAGRSAKRQLFLLPGGIERHLKIKTCSVAQDVIEELCCEMGLQRPEAFEEYILFVVTDRGQNVRPLSRREYILDVATETERLATGYTFWCRRVVWSQPLKFDNELYVTVHYNQVLPDYLKGLFTVLPPSRLGEQHFQQLAKLAALQHRAKDGHRLPTAYGHGREPPSRGDWEPPGHRWPHPPCPRRREVQDYVPPQLFQLLTAQSWLHAVTQHAQQAQALSAHQARAQFLELQQQRHRLALHPGRQPERPQLPQQGHPRRRRGAADGGIPASPSPCGPNPGWRPSPGTVGPPKNLAPRPSLLLRPLCWGTRSSGSQWGSWGLVEPVAKFSLREIQATRTRRPSPGSSSPYVEITLGELLAQGITQLQLEQGLELCRVVAAHVERLLGAREKRLTLPPSEITLL